jgi:hypothetical protein
MGSGCFLVGCDSIGFHCFATFGLELTSLRWISYKKMILLAGGGTWTFHDSNEQKIANIFSSKKIYCAFLEK